MTKKPSYRFAGYTEPWTEKKLGEVLTERNIQMVPSDQVPLVSFTVENGVTPKTERYNREFLVREESKKYKYTRYNDIVYNPANLKFGAIARNKYGKAVFSPIYVTFEVNYSNILPEFIEGILTSKDFIQQALKFQEGTVYERMAVKADDFTRLAITVPSLPEQTAIGSLFQDIDQLISLQQRKLEVLKEQKKTYLKLLFPTKGQTKPALRFAGFENDWKEVKLGEVGETYTGLSGKTKEDFGHGEGKFITYVNVFNNPLTDLYGLDSIEIDDKQRRVQYGDVLFTTSSETPEDVGLSSVWMGTEDNVYLNSFCFGYRPQKGIFDLYYLAFVLRSFSVRKEFMLLAQGISRFNISKTKVMDMSIHVPSLPEQEAIGSFFQDLDKSIAKQEEKVNQLKESKQTLLRKMFI